MSLVFADVLCASALSQSLRSVADTHKIATDHDIHGYPLALTPSINVSCSIPEGTAISQAAACRTSVIAARARDAREMYPVSIVSFGSDFGRT